jgi:hypothetical protein
MGCIENDACNSSSVVEYVFGAAVTFLPRPLPSNYRMIHKETQTGGRDL